EQQPGALGVDGDGVVEVETGALEGREVHDVGEVVGHAGEVATTQVARHGGDPQRVDPLAIGRIGEARDAPDLVVAREGAGQRERDLPGRPGDEDLLARQHAVDVIVTPCRASVLGNQPPPTNGSTGSSRWPRSSNSRTGTRWRSTHATW